MDPILTRRTVLAVGVTGAGAAALAACSSSSKSSGAVSSPAGVGQTGQSPTGSGVSTDQSTGKDLAKLSDITVGEAVSAKLADGSPAIVARPTATTAACFSAICTHQGCTVKPAGKELHCPCHGSVYDAVTGEVKHGPAPKALAKVAVHVANDEVVEG
jgi:cytochrome b6-f complex iron-sulfur subunit